MFVLMPKRPALISVMHGVPWTSSLKSKTKIPDASGSMARMAREHVSTIRASHTVLEGLAIQKESAGVPRAQIAQAFKRAGRWRVKSVSMASPAGAPTRQRRRLALTRRVPTTNLSSESGLPP